MARIDFLIANPGHHLEAAEPVAEELIARGFECGLVSLCEMRGLRSPTASKDDGTKLGVRRLVPHTFRRSPSQGGGTKPPTRSLRSVARELFWYLYLAPRVRSWLASTPALVVVPNDAAFPYDRICRELERREILFLLLQEGIRFAETKLDDSEIVGQGLAGAAGIACWGETSAEFFRARGAPPASIHATGSPRFDRILTNDWKTAAEVLSRSLPSGDTTLTVLTNPIEVWGFCSGREKMELLAEFVRGLDPLFESAGLRVLFKIHRQESLRDYRAMVESQPHAHRMEVLGDAPLYPLLQLSDAAVVLASTVGLEALLLGIPLGVLEIPGLGFAHDFVSGGAARGLRRSEPAADQVEALLGDDPCGNQSLAAYLDRTLSARGCATQSVADVVADLVEPSAALT